MLAVDRPFHSRVTAQWLDYKKIEPEWERNVDDLVSPVLAVIIRW